MLLSAQKKALWIILLLVNLFIVKSATTKKEKNNKLDAVKSLWSKTTTNIQSQSLQNIISLWVTVFFMFATFIGWYVVKTWKLFCIWSSGGFRKELPRYSFILRSHYASEWEREDFLCQRRRNMVCGRDAPRWIGGDFPLAAMAAEWYAPLASYTIHSEVNVKLQWGKTWRLHSMRGTRTSSIYLSEPVTYLSELFIASQELGSTHGVPFSVRPLRFGPLGRAVK